MSRPDIRLEPDGTFADGVGRPLIAIELKYQRDADSAGLKRLAQDALQRIEDRRYDGGALLGHGASCIHWGIACSGKRVEAASESVCGV